MDRPQLGSDLPGDALARYLELERRLLAWREAHALDTPEEDALLDLMDDAWFLLTPAETALLNGRNMPDKPVV